MSYSPTKKASTPIPLSPEEQYEASQHFGKSLFSALQLVREQQRKKNMLMNGESSQGGDDKVLRIPIPSNLMPSSKTAAEGAPYVGAQDPFEPAKNPGVLAHIQRNLGKYIGSYGGAILGAGMGARGVMKSNPAAGISKVLGGAGRRGLVGGVAGTSLGSMFDDSTKDSYREQALQQAHMHKRQMLQNMYADENMGDYGGYKQGSDIEEESEPGIFGRAFKAQQNPLRLLSGGQTGFRDAKKEYYMRQRGNINSELADAQREYIDLLGKIKTGEVKPLATPYVDAFCNGIAYATLFDKEASHEDVDISDGSMKRLMGGVMDQVKKPFQPIVDTAASGLLGTGTGAAYLTYLLRKSMREEPENYMQEGLPTRVELQPYT